MRARSGPQFADYSLQFREAFEELKAVGYRQEYYLNRDSRFRPRPPGISAVGSGADFHLADEALALKGIERAYHFDRNNMVIGAAVDRLVANVLSDLPTCKPLTGDEQLDADLAAAWYAWTDSPDACDDALESTFHDLAKLAFRGMIVGGDSIAVGLDSGRLATFEAYRCRKPRNTTQNVIRGVLVDDRRRHLEYWLTKQELSPTAPLARVADVQKVATRDENGERVVFHLLDRKRSSQTRGVSAFAPCVDAIGMHDDLQFAALVKAQMAACWAIFEEVTAGAQVGTPGTLPTPTPNLNADAASTAVARVDDGYGREEEEFRPGMRVRGRPGVKPTGFSPNIPNPEFFPHVKLILTFVAINLKIPLQMMLLEPQANFSAWRGAVEEARKGFEQQQRLIVARFFAPIYRWRLLHLIAADRAFAAAAERIGPKFFEVDLLMPRWRYIQPKDDAQADAARKRYMLDSPRKIAAERQLDYSELVRETMEDNSLAIRTACDAARKLKAEYPEFTIDWRDLYQPPTVDQVAGKSSDPNPKATAAAPQPEPPDDPNEPTEPDDDDE